MRVFAFLATASIVGMVAFGCSNDTVTPCNVASYEIYGCALSAVAACSDGTNVTFQPAATPCSPMPGPYADIGAIGKPPGVTWT